MLFKNIPLTGLCMFQKKRICFRILTAVCFTLLFLLIKVDVFAAERLQQTSNPIVIVIDPGHGAENFGTIQNGFTEKKMTLITANAIYEELLQYENVEVYLTRTTDCSLSLKERAEFAASVQADFLFSIHYNASETHRSYGTEVWIPTVMPYQAYAYQFAYNHLQNMEAMGLFNRGIKSRLGDSGKDYYGILRESVKLDLTACIIEHCHVDHGMDSVFCDSEEELIQFGKEDAKSIAQYFGLRKKSGEVDYSNHPVDLPFVDLTQAVPDVWKDNEDPEELEVVVKSADYAQNEFVVQVHAKDSESPIMYYTYSLDGGYHFTDYIPWPGVDMLLQTYDQDVEIRIPVEGENRPRFIFRVYNQYELCTESEPYIFTERFALPVDSYEDSSLEPINTDYIFDTTYEKEEENEMVDSNDLIDSGFTVNSVLYNGAYMLAIFLLIVVALTLIVCIYKIFRKK